MVIWAERVSMMLLSGGRIKVRALNGLEIIERMIKEGIVRLCVRSRLSI